MAGGADAAAPGPVAEHDTSPSQDAAAPHDPPPAGAATLLGAAAVPDAAPAHGPSHGPSHGPTLPPDPQAAAPDPGAAPDTTAQQEEA
jgi:hypothetical protein